MAINKYFYCELTDTFGGEANYSWVTRFKVRASTMRGAMLKVGRVIGLNFRCVMDSGDMRRYDSVSGATCLFVEWFDEENHGQYGRIESI